ncbi:MAG: hypothetical protein KF773_04770 [Deltaproteobacteria bacterium]|nr:hypothetical protein [Deltaproteobacteria bacterium]
MDEPTAHRAATAMVELDQIVEVRVTFNNGQSFVGRVHQWGAGGYVPQVTLVDKTSTRFLALEWEHVTSVLVTYLDGSKTSVP